MWVEVLKYVSVIISSGIWVAILNCYKEKKNIKSADKQMILGLGHDRLFDLCVKYIERGWITADELENLNYLFEPYKSLGGNVTCERLMEDVFKLPHKRVVTKYETVSDEEEKEYGDE